jgi:hypothetical protein
MVSLDDTAWHPGGAVCVQVESTAFLPSRPGAASGTPAADLWDAGAVAWLVCHTLMEGPPPHPPTVNVGQI